MIKQIKPEDLSYEDYIAEKEKNPLFFWNYKRKGWSYNNIFLGTGNVGIGYSAGYVNTFIGYAAVTVT